jgi:hypothetical protein
VGGAAVHRFYFYFLVELGYWFLLSVLSSIVFSPLIVGRKAWTGETSREV